MISDTVERKFIENIDASDWLIETDTGWEEIPSSNKTVEYEIYEVTLDGGQILKCADTHIFFDAHLNEVFAKDSLGSFLHTNTGPKKVLTVVPTGVYDNMYDLSVDSDTHRYYADGVLCHNSITTCSYLLWYAIFNPEKTVAILANKGSTAREMLSRITLMLENLPFWLQPGCKVLNKGSIEFENNSKIITAATSSSSIRGTSISVLYIDEFAFVKNDVEFYTSTYPVISSGKYTKIIITSTANGVGNVFYKLWQGAEQGVNEFKSTRVDWWDVPGRDEKWKLETISNTSEIQFAQEYGNDFLLTSDTLISGNTLLKLKAKRSIEHDDNMNIYERPIEGKKYIITVDVSKGRGQDYSVFSVIDVTATPFRQVAVYRNNTLSPLLFPDVIFKYAIYYNKAFVVVESNDSGEVVCNGLYHELEYENLYVESFKKDALGVRMTKKVKRIGCSNLKDLIESDKLEVYDAETIKELSTFSAVGTSYEASRGNHDDLVLSLVMLGYFVTLPEFQDYSDMTIRELIQEQRMSEIENDLLPFGFIENGLQEDIKNPFDLSMDDDYFEEYARDHDEIRW